MFRYLSHTADVMFEAEGKTIEEAFENSGLAIFNIITDVEKVKKKIKVDFSVKADKLEKMLFDFLDQLIFYLDTEHLVFSSFKIKIKGDLLECSAYGDKIEKYERHGDIKAPTYNEMSIKQTKDGWVIRAVVDI